MTITRVDTQDRRFPLRHGAGSDAVHSGAEYAFAVTRLYTDAGTVGSGITLTLGSGNHLVCQAIEHLGQRLVGRDVEELMSEWGAVSRSLADDAALRWLGPHKGVVHLALASLTNACFDLWAKRRGVPLWRLLLDLSPERLVALLDLSYVEDELGPSEALAMLRDHLSTRDRRAGILRSGYPGYDTSAGWLQYDDARLREHVTRALDDGFRAVKLKVGSKDRARDLRRVAMVREIVGPGCRLMCDANQSWNLCEALSMCRDLSSANLYWIEEPTHPDDVEAHRIIAREIAPTRVALGEHLPNRVAFKNFIRARAVHFVQADCTRLAGVSEFLTVSLLARKHDLPLVPHVGDMGQIHQHLVLFNHVAMGHEVVFLEHIPHLRQYFVHPTQVGGGVYATPQAPGASCELLDEAT